MKFNRFNVSLFLIILFSLSFITAGFTQGNPQSNLTKVYVPSSAITGWINLSFVNQNFNSLFKVGANSITLKELLDKNPESVYTCSSSECGMTYGSSGSSLALQDFDLNAGDSEIIGVKITENYPLNSIGQLVFNINSDAAESCSSPVSIDLFDDGIVDWTADKQSNSFCSANYGCYDNSASSIISIVVNPAKTYCEQISVNPAPALRVGANLLNTASGQSEFKFSVVELDGKYCSNKTSSSGEISCIINQSIIEPRNITVCMNKISGNEYKINVEDTSPICGLIGDSEWDMNIFAKPMKYGAVGSMTFNSSTIIDADILSYLSNQYADCSVGCYIPIKLISGVSQLMAINSLSMKYESRDVEKSVSSFFIMESIPSVINSGFIKLGLDSSGLKSPTISGKSNISLYLDSSLVLTQAIENLNVPLIDSLIPLEVPLGVDTKFYVFVLGSGATSYKWKFGENDTLVTTKPTVNYEYLTMGTYTLDITAVNLNGENKKSFTINVISPKDYINNTLNENKIKITNLRNQISNLSTPIKNYINKKLDLTNLEITNQQLLTRFSSAGEDTSEYSSIIDAMPKISIPDSIALSEKASGKLLIDKSQINLDSLKIISGESTSASEDEITKSVFDWVLRNIDINFDIKSYSAVYGELKSPLVSDVILKFLPLGEAGNVYVVVNKAQSSLEGISGVGTLIPAGDSTGFLVNLASGGQTTTEFLVSDAVSISSLPLYLSPKLSELALALTLEPCNYNKICESSFDETSENCPSDCIPWKNFAWFAIIIILVILVIYITIQELYKRYYENKLFKNKDELFNLINFMDNAEKQGLKREQIIEKLKNTGWSEKKIIYAYKKYKGERKGVWEIPLFSFMEKKKVQKGLEQYRKDNVSVKSVQNTQKRK